MRKVLRSNPLILCELYVWQGDNPADSYIIRTINTSLTPHYRTMEALPSELWAHIVSFMPTEISDLPDELLEHIFSFVPCINLSKSVGLVSTRWASVRDAHTSRQTYSQCAAHQPAMQKATTIDRCTTCFRNVLQIASVFGHPECCAWVESVASRTCNVDRCDSCITFLTVRARTFNVMHIEYGRAGLTYAA
jgi:hypothetical protein